jgi:hypothetical protein
MASNWTQSRMRTWLGVIVAVVGLVLLVVGWYDVSGEADVGRQMPYLVSASLPGAALLVCGAVLIAAERWRDAAARSDQKIEALYALFTEPAERADAAGQPDNEGTDPRVEPDLDGHLVTVDGSTRYHRPACPLLTGKATHDVDRDELTAKALEPCPVCEPPVPAA